MSVWTFVYFSRAAGACAGWAIAFNQQEEQMGPRQKLVTVVWCLVTMAATLVLSHGHLIMREILERWPEASTWEGRLENALYTQGGLMLLAGVCVSAGLVLRGFLGQRHADMIAARERAQRERHERAAELRHESLCQALERLTGATYAKKSSESAVRPR
jgi:triphosphoribosyl-dephospho-CoA synthetase